MTPRATRPAPTSASGSPLSAADRRRRDILAKSAVLFDEFGYRETSMNDIADAVGVRKPTLYHYFDTKDEILFWIHEEFINTLIIEGRQVLEGDYIASDEVIKVINRQPTLQNEPGAEFNYNNSAFALATNCGSQSSPSMRRASSTTM